MTCNTLIDSGASCCIIDKSSFQNLRAGEMRKTNKTFLDASGNNMTIIGSTVLEIRPMGSREIKRVEFFVSDSESHRCILLGRNFMGLFNTVTFDFENNRVKFGDQWCSGLHVQNRVRSTS